MLVDCQYKHPAQHPDVSLNINLKASSLVVYRSWEGKRKPNQLDAYGITKERKAPSRPDLLSHKSQARIRHYTELLIETAKTQHIWSQSHQAHFRFKLNFITLTLSSQQVHDDQHIYKNIFKPFLRIIRDRLPGLLYIWKAEVQDNGNIHFHITTNKFIYHSRLRKIWNDCQLAAGYIKPTANQNPNSIDVHAVKKVKNLPAYLCKYLTKADSYSRSLKRYHRRFDKVLSSGAEQTDKWLTDNEGAKCILPKNYLARLKRHVKMKIWDCSQALKKGSCRIQNFDIDFEQELNDLRKIAKKVIETEHATILIFRSGTYNKTTLLKDVWLKYLQDLEQMSAIDSSLN